MRRRRRPAGAGPGAISALLIASCFLLALFTPASEPENHRFVLDLHPSVEILLLLAAFGLLGMRGRPLGLTTRLAATAVIGTAALIHAIDAVMPAVFGRTLDLYWDVGHVPSLLGLFFDSAGATRGGIIAAAIGGGALVALGLVFLAVTTISWAAARRGIASLLLLLPCILALGAALPPGPDGNRPVSTSLSREIARQGRDVVLAWQVSHGHLGKYAAVLAAPQRRSADLAGLKGGDVLLIYVESYGTVALDEPRYREVVGPALDRFAAKVAAAGYGLVSDRILSPTFGGGSWLAHGTMGSGIRLDQLTSRLLLASNRLSLPRYLSAAGYRTVEIMPGIKNPLAEDRFWGFDKSYYAADLGYDGPGFGWFDIPDQYTLKTFAEREKHSAKPLFAQIVLVSSHTPFYPVPPYVADWSDAGPYKSIGRDQWDRIYRQPDWNRLDAPYRESLAYDFDVLGDFLSGLVADGTLVIILGDHQPPAFITGDKQPWTVPIYVLAKDLDLLAPFVAQGYTAGAFPQQKAPFLAMEGFLPAFLDGFSTNGSNVAATDVHP
ncbi:MAG: hypothetical protein JWL84_487 [Rhodospirillales bacterium]|nr:hypothetical protein [Rhodospirillales bacterium]